MDQGENVMALQDTSMDTEVAERTGANIVGSRRLLEALLAHHGIKERAELQEPEIDADAPPDAIHVPIIAASDIAEPIEIFVLPIPEPTLTIDGIKRAVCSHYGVTHNDLVSPRRGSRIVWPRQMAMYLCREFTSRSLPEIARKFGNRDHTTALHAVNKVRIKIHSDAAVAAEVSHFREYLSA